MKYNIDVVICNPNTPKGMNSDICLALTAEFVCDPNQYGNKHFVAIYGEGFSEQAYDIRYDRSFRRDHKEEWLENWARSYWNGKDGAYTVKRIKIEKI